jgi:hypothetical protein
MDDKVLPAAATDLSSIKLNLKDANACANTRKLYEHLASLVEGPNPRQSISKEERRKRTKAKKMAKKQRNK